MLQPTQATFSPPTHPPSACMRFNPGPTPLTFSTDGHGAVWTCVKHPVYVRQPHHSPGIGESEVELRDTGVGYRGMATSYAVSELAVQKRDGGKRLNQYPSCAA